MNIKYTKRAKGGYYAFTPVGTVIVHRYYEFTLPTRDWVATCKGNVVIGTSRKNAVETMINRIQK